MSRNLLAKTLLALAFLSGFSACIEQEFDSYSLHVKARGLSDTESIIVSANNSNLEITGTSDLSWTELKKFNRSYREDSPNFSVRIIRQPSSSNKVCRVLNPSGQASKSVSIIRIECGYPVVIADEVSYTSMGTQPPSMTSDNGLIVSNYLQTVALNSSRRLTTSLDNVVDDTVLRVSPNVTTGAITFQKLYTEGEVVTLSFSSIHQGCEITGANDNSGLVFNYPSAGTFMNTVQTLDLTTDWIQSGTDFSNGRSCSDFTKSESFLTYEELENPGLLTSYTAECFPTAPVLINCGFALKAKVRGLDTSAGEFIRLTAHRDPLGLDLRHTLDLTQTFTQSYSRRGMKTFNLAFIDNQTYTIDIDGASNLGGKNCIFSSSGTSQGAGTINNSNTIDTITCN